MYQEFLNRRSALAQKLQNNSIAILPSATLLYRNRDAEFQFRQESSFYYLTGLKEPKALAIFTKDTEGKTEFILFCNPSNPEEEIWTGHRIGVEGAKDKLGADKSFPITELNIILPSLFENKKQIYYTLGKDRALDETLFHALNIVKEKARKGIEFPTQWLDLAPLIAEQRLIKSPFEIDLMRKSAEISANVHVQLMKKCKPDLKEYQLEADFVYECMKQGCRSMAYNSIVGGGANGCILHYINNDDTLKDGELVLVDAGSEYDYYAADITRTYPVNGKFTPDQKAIYNLVLKSQLAAIDLIKPGTVYDKLQEKILEILVAGLIELGILKGDINQLIEQKAYHKYYMHSSGHWLGLDVHDVGHYKVDGKWRTLEPGMVLTVEPGLYFTPKTEGLDKRWWRIGVRIEDDILVTEKGHEVLSKSVPKTIEEIENIMKK